jgi:PEP-CTERM motif
MRLEMHEWQLQRACTAVNAPPFTPGRNTMKFDPAVQRTLCAAALLLATAMAPTWAANSATVALSPMTRTVTVNDTFSLSLQVSDATDLIGAYDFGVALGTAGIIGLQSVTFSGALGADADQQSSLPGSFAEVSLALNRADIEALQAASGFTLATLNFKALTAGTTSVSLSPSLVGDFNGDAMDLSLIDASVTVKGGIVGTIPEPSTYALMGACLLVIARTVRRKA